VLVIRVRHIGHKKAALIALGAKQIEYPAQAVLKIADVTGLKPLDNQTLA